MSKVVDDVVHDVLHHDVDRAGPVEAPHDALEVLELVGPGHLAGREGLGTSTFAAQAAIHVVHRAGGQEGDRDAHQEVRDVLVERRMPGLDGMADDQSDRRQRQQPGRRSRSRGSGPRR